MSEPLHEHRLLMLALAGLLVGCPSTPNGQLDDDDATLDDDDATLDDDDDDAAALWPALRLNEFMADNDDTVQDASGTWADWVELHNPTGDDLALDGWVLADDLDGFEDGHLLDALSIDAGGHLLLWADGDVAEGPSHLDFRLASEGEELALFAPDGTLIDALAYGQQAPDVSTARAFDGDGAWLLVDGGTPGASNGSDGPAAGDEQWPGPGPGCAMAATGGEPGWFTEGDAIDFLVACSGELATQDATIEPLRLPDGASFDSGALSVAWQTGPASGGHADLVFSIRSEGAEVPHAGIVSLQVADDPFAADNVPVEPASYTQEWGLPVIHVLPSAPLTQEYVAAELWYEGHRYDAGIKIRGAASVGYPKNSFTLRFDAAELPIEQWDVTRNRLVLVTTFDDNSYVRQKLIFDLWAAIGAYWGADRLTPRSFFAVLYLDGDYFGLYVALDHVDDEFMGQMGLDDTGNLYKSVNHDANFGPTMANGSPKTNLHAGWEKKEGLPEDDFSDLDALVEFTASATAEELVAGAPSWIDPAEFMDWFLLVHYSDSGDSGGKNAYLYSDPGGSGFRYVPWDFNDSWGQNWRTFRVDPNELDYFQSRNRVFWAQQTVPEASDELWARFAAMRADGPFATSWLSATLDAYYAQIQPSAERDWERWQYEYYSYGGWADSRNGSGDWTDFEGEKAYLYAWLDARAAIFEDNHPE